MSLDDDPRYVAIHSQDPDILSRLAARLDEFDSDVGLEVAYALAGNPALPERALTDVGLWSEEHSHTVEFEARQRMKDDMVL